MYLHLGQETVVRFSDIIGIFDIENASISKYTKDFLKNSEKKLQVINVSYELPKSFIVCQQGNDIKVFISQISPATLKKRARQALAFDY